MAEYKLGVIGGMGPKATAVFYDQIVTKTAASKDQDHIDMVILNHATLPDRTSVIISGNGSLFLDAIRSDMKLLELAGVAHIAIPCNTSHYFYEELQSMTPIPIINMVEETVKAIYDRFGEGAKIGLLATKGTARSEIYERACSKYNMKLYTPDEVLQEQIMNIIYNNIKGDLPIDAEEIESIIRDLVYEQGMNCVIIGCTELSVIQLNDEVAKYAFDAMGILVEKAIQLSGKQVKKY